MAINNFGHSFFALAAMTSGAVEVNTVYCIAIQISKTMFYVKIVYNLFRKPLYLRLRLFQKQEITLQTKENKR